MTLALPISAPKRDALRFRISRLAANRPGTYRMLDTAGRVIYVGKAKAIRTRLLSYFRARYPEDKGARILQETAQITFEYTHSEFAAALAELRLIRKYRPPWNVAMNRGRRQCFLVLTSEDYPRLLATTSPDKLTGRRYGPLPSPQRSRTAAIVLSDLLALRDCRLDFSRSDMQGDLFGLPSQAACPRHDFGTCLAPCIRVCDADYAQRVALAAAFCEGRGVTPLRRVIDQMHLAASAGEYHLAIRWRERFEALEWLLSSTTRARNSTSLLTFAYRDPGHLGDDRIYLIRNGEIRACYPDPVTPLEREAFRAVVRQELEQPGQPQFRPDPEVWHQRLLVMSWFRNHPQSWHRTTTLSEWV